MMLVLVAATCMVKGAAQDPYAVKKSPKGKVTVVDKAAPVKTWTVKGWGKTAEDAEKHALNNAVEIVGSYLKQLQPPLEWMPSAGEIRKRLFAGTAQPCANEEKQVVDGELVGCWSWTLTLTPSHLESMRHEDADLRARRAVEDRTSLAATRMTKLTKVVAVLLIGLGGVWLISRAIRGGKPK